MKLVLLNKLWSKRHLYCILYLFWFQKAYYYDNVNKMRVKLPFALVTTAFKLQACLHTWTWFVFTTFVKNLRFLVDCFSQRYELLSRSMWTVRVSSVFNLGYQTSSAGFTISQTIFYSGFNTVLCYSFFISSHTCN